MDYSIYYVPAGNVLGILVTFILCFALPVGLCIIWKIRTKANLAPVFVGAATFFVAALVLEQLARSVITLFAGTYLQTHLWAAAVFGGLMAGLFEETGRFVAMKWIMKKQLNKENAIMYGIGHGGIEAMLITGMTYFSNIVLVILINTGNMALLFTGLDEPTRELVFNQLKALWELQPSAFLLAGVERISAILAETLSASSVLSFATKPAVADVNGDGKQEVIFASYTQLGQKTQRGSLYVLDGTGKPLATVVLPPALSSAAASANGCMAQPTVADVDRDGKPEIVLTTIFSGIVVYDIG